MKIVLARSAGFCFGVRSAVDRISRSLRRHRRIQIDGDLIHNPQTIRLLSRRGLTKVFIVDGSAPVAIRTHGTTAEKLRAAHTQSDTVYNLTCPKVSRIQGIIRKYSRDGYYTLLVGDEGHPEIISLKSYAESGISVIRAESDIPQVELYAKLILLSQTTKDRALFESIRSLVTARAPWTVVFDTICDSTGNKQSELREALAEGADTVVVIGGKHSANTQSLAAIARNAGAKTLHVESAAECDEEDFSGSSFIFVTAGASTPDWAISETMDRLRELRLGAVSRALRTAYNLLHAAFYLHIPAAVSAWLAYYTLSGSAGSAALAAGSYTAFSLAAELTLLPFTAFSDHRRYLFHAHPLRFLRSGSFSGGADVCPGQSGGAVSLALRLGALAALPVSWIVSHGALRAEAVLLLAFTASSVLARELREEAAGLVTGRISLSPEGKKGIILLLAAAAAGIASAFFASGAGRTAAILLSAAPLFDCASASLTYRGKRTSPLAAEAARLILAAVAASMSR